MGETMRMQSLVLLTLFLLALGGCASQKKIDTAVSDATIKIKEDVTTLEEQVSSLTAERDRLAAAQSGLQSAADAATGQLTSLQTTIQQQKDAMKSYADDLSTCEQDRRELNAENENLTKKTTVLQKWVDACQETLGNLG